MLDLENNNNVNLDHENEKIDDNSNVPNDVPNAYNIEILGIHNKIYV